MFKQSSIAITCALSVLLAAPAWTQGNRPADPPSAAVRDSAPDRYVVQRGDTLWTIATRFLKEPWRWPELWRFNEAQIRNPHLIYPGMTLALDRATGKLSLAEAPSGNDRLSPRVRVEPLPSDAIPSIPPNAIEPWLSRPLVIEDGALDGAPEIFAAEEGRYHLGAGGRAYVKGIPANSTDTQWQIYRPGRPLIDPETKAILAHEAIYVGTARTVRKGEPTTVEIKTAVLEVTPGDRLVAEGQPRVLNYMPHSPASGTQARVISIYGGRGDSSILGREMSSKRTDVADYDSRREAGPLQIVSINRGERDGLALGHVLALHRDTLVKHDRSTGSYYMGGPRAADVRLPEERYGLVFVFRTFDRVSYGLIVQAQRPVVPGDVARTP